MESAVPMESDSRGIKYYRNLKKYNKIVQFISDRMDLRTEEKQKGFNSFYSQSLPTSPNSHSVSPIKKHYSAVVK
jgi:hypothetical protein